jgi:hypothetical protein
MAFKCDVRRGGKIYDAREVPPKNWGLRGCFPVSEIELGFRIDV